MNGLSDNQSYRFPVSVKGVVVRDGEVVLLANERHEWELPGGKLEPEETPETCVVREIEEELQLDVRAERLLDTWIYTIAPGVPVLVVTYGCVERKRCEAAFSDEHRGMRWFPIDEVGNLRMPEGYKRSIESWVRSFPRGPRGREGSRGNRSWSTMTHIAAASPAELDEVLALITAQFEEHAIAAPLNRLRAAIGAALDDPRLGLFLLARRDGRAVGVAYVSFVWALEHCGRACWLEELYVVPSERGRGLGARLLQTVLAETTARGCAAVDLEVEHSQKRAENLYRRAGFEPHTRARWVRRANVQSD